MEFLDQLMTCLALRGEVILELGRVKATNWLLSYSKVA